MVAGQCRAAGKHQLGRLMALVLLACLLNNNLNSIFRRRNNSLLVQGKSVLKNTAATRISSTNSTTTGQQKKGNVAVAAYTKTTISEDNGNLPRNPEWNDVKRLKEIHEETNISEGNESPEPNEAHISTSSTTAESGDRDGADGGQSQAGTTQLIVPPLVSRETIAADQASYYRNLPPWPRWGHGEGIDMDLLLQFIFGLGQRRAFTIESPQRRNMFFETLYVVNHAGVWVSHGLQTRGSFSDTRARSIPTEQSMKRAFQILRKDFNRVTDDAGAKKPRWPRLTQAVLEEKGGFPFVAWYGDFKSCNYLNWNRTHSIPVFTVCGEMNCSYGFPMPTYLNLGRARYSADQWKDVMANNFSKTYPWSSKIRQVVWRGALSGRFKDPHTPRMRIAKFAAKCCRGNGTMPPLDIGLSRIPEKRDSHGPKSINSHLGGLLAPIPQDAFQSYVGILDIDGNSWSSRFGSLLCYNSVILKVEPEHVDHFYHFVGHEEPLLPWKHFIPVKADLSDLIEKAELVADPQNDGFLQQMIQNANAWCQQHMIVSALDEDYLDLWEAYVKQLDLANLNWSELWKTAKQGIFESKSPFRMRKDTLSSKVAWTRARAAADK